MKPVMVQVFPVPPDTLYPTWFRWNPVIAAAEEKPERLYIPHGSDETLFDPELILNRIFFISHMVQMKPHPKRYYW